MARIIASVFAQSLDQIVADGRRAAMLGADWLELRLDHWAPHEPLGTALRQVQLPVLVACRTREDGGFFRGTLRERRELLAHALQAGAAGIDLEHWEEWAPPAGLTGLRLRIRSFHSFTGVPKELAAIQRDLHGHPGQVAKLVVTAHDLADAAPVLDLLRHTDQERQPTVAFAMGRTAWPTRVLAAVHGAPFVYGALASGAETAPGQPPVAQLAGLYRVRELGPATRVFGLFGNPALQSLGPWLHNRAFRRLRRDAVYLPFETSRPEAVLAMLDPRAIAGLSVTAPFKERLFAWCGRCGDEAAAVGAINTLVADGDGGFVGYNTDIAGVRDALLAAGLVAGSGRRAAVLGAGGGARAAVAALRELGCEVALFGRSLEPVRDYAAAIGLPLGNLSTQAVTDWQPDVLVQATPVGSLDRDPEERVLPGFVPRVGTLVLDMVYRPHRTRFLRDLEAAGAVTVPGVEMFLRQAAEQVRLFAGEQLGPAVLRGFLAGTALAERHDVGLAPGGAGD